MRLVGSTTALVVVDLQRAFCAPDGSVAAQGRDVSACAAVVPTCRDLADRVRGAAGAVVWTQFVLRPDYADGGVLVHELRPGIAQAGGLRAGTPDVALADGITPAVTDDVVDKARFSAFYASRLEPLLRARRIDTVVVCGVTTSMCVESTARDASQRDYRTYVVADACGDVTVARHQAALDALAFGFAHITDAAAVVRGLSEPANDHSERIQ